MGSSLRNFMLGHLVPFNRAPTSHRIGIQAFQPILIEGCIVRLHPSVREGCNTNLDEDQRVVHVSFKPLNNNSSKIFLTKSRLLPS